MSRRQALIAIILAGAVAACVAAVFLARKPIAEALVESYLRGEGADSRVAVDSLDWSGISGSIQVGDANVPDFTGEQFFLSFAWDGLVPTISAVRLVRPSLRIAYDEEGVHFGSLQQLVDSFRRAPRDPNARIPDIAIDDGLVRVHTVAGDVRLRGTLSFADNRLAFLRAAIAPAKLRSPAFDGDLRGGIIETQPAGDDLQLSVRIGGNAAARLADAVVHLEALELSSAGTLQTAGSNWQFDGVTEADAARLQLDRPGEQMRFAARDIKARLRGMAGSTAGGLVADLHLALGAAAQIPGDTSRMMARKIPLLGSDIAFGSAITSALQDIRFGIADLHLIRGEAGTRVTLPSPVVIAGKSGAKLLLSETKANDLFAATGGEAKGAFDFSLAGGGLPALDLLVSHYTRRLRDDSAIDADGHIKARLNAQALRGLALDTDWRGSLAGDTVGLSMDHCGALVLAAFASGKNTTIRAAKAQLCPDGDKPILTAQGAQWQFRARFRTLSARIDAAPALLSGAVGAIAFQSGQDSVLRGAVDIATARLSDSQKAPRFAPLVFSGHVGGAGNAWRGNVSVLSAKNRTKIAAIALRHSLKTGAGEAHIRAADIAFDPKRLQPADLSPLLSSFAKAKGAASFDGIVSWTKGRTASHGKLIVDALDFTSPLGAVTKARAAIALSSLIPLATEPNQDVTAERIDWFVPLSQLHMSLQLAGASLHLQQAQANAAGGTIALDPLVLGLGGGTGVAGTVRLNNVDLGAIIAASNLGSKIKADVRIAGAIPFSTTARGVRIADGRINAMGAGHLSISRDLWSSEASVAGNAMQDFAFQALEHLAIEKMDGTINSLPQGRLGLVLHIKGQNDPATAVEAQLSVIDLLRGNAFNKPIALPKGTPIDLTLDTSLNFDELLSAYRDAFSMSVRTTH